MGKFQILFIHGGEAFRNRENYLNYLRSRKVKLNKEIYWSEDYLNNELGKNFQTVIPRMPLQDNANYEDWEIVFENYLNAMNENIILVGISLGGIFLSKYLSENKVNKKILSVYMIAPPFDDTLPNDDLAGGFELGEDLNLIEENCDDVTLMFSKDDDCVPVSHAEKYREKLRSSEIIIYDDKNGHFGISEFPEIVGMIKEDVRNFIKE
jgi:predicted alpha/beta hydrolase family esterase